jgi:predicted metal-dependent hydrolase
LERSTRAKTIGISVRPFKGVRVAVPYGVSYKQAERFARSKIGWIKKHADKMSRVEHQAMAMNRNHPIDRAAARAVLLKRTQALSKRHHLPFNRLFVRNQRTRWGSCSGKNNISLNVNLVRLPDELIDYTILHELVHTRVKNHGKAFWERLEALVGDSKGLDKKLNAYNFFLVRPDGV